MFLVHSLSLDNVNIIVHLEKYNADMFVGLCEKKRCLHSTFKPGSNQAIQIVLISYVTGSKLKVVSFESPEIGPKLLI